MRTLARIRAHAEAYLRELTRQPAPAADLRSVYLTIAELERRRASPDPEPSLDLSPYELRVFSQNGEDGVLDEILRRTGVATRTFVEFGAGPGIEGTCIYLADVCGWSGRFI